MTILQRLRRWLRAGRPARGASGQPEVLAIPDNLWEPVIQAYGFLQALAPADNARLRALCGAFLASKEFHGANGLQVTDRMALAVAAQACLPLLHMGGLEALDWYSDFVGIVLHPGRVLARRESVDEAGVVHHWKEAITGEAMQGGPVMLSWQDASPGMQKDHEGYNVVIHEFAHVMDMHGKTHGEPEGCPLLYPGCMGYASATRARQYWKAVLDASHQRFRDQVEASQRFSTLVSTPWLDPYAAESPGEFFAVTAEAYFVAPDGLARDFPELLPLYDAFFRRVPGPGQTRDAGREPPVPYTSRRSPPTS